VQTLEALLRGAAAVGGPGVPSPSASGGADGVLACLIRPPPPPPPVLPPPARGALALAEEHVARFALNPEQADVARAVAAWLPPGAAAASAAGAAAPQPRHPGGVALIHGPFGTGKSSLLVALVHLLTANFRPPPPAAGGGAGGGLSRGAAKAAKAAAAEAAAADTDDLDAPGGLRVLIAAHTNVAVDRVMQGAAAACGACRCGGSAPHRLSTLARRCSLTSPPLPPSPNPKPFLHSTKLSLTFFKPSIRKP